MKKIIAILGLFAFTTQAQLTKVDTNIPATNKIEIATGLVLQQITAYTTNATPTFLYLYDDFYFHTNAAWTNYTSAITNVVFSYVTTTGITNSYTNQMYKTFASEHAASEAVATPIITLLVPGAPSGGTALITFDEPALFANRMTISNSATGLNLLISYRNK